MPDLPASAAVLALPGVRSVHTFGMRFAIDAAFVARYLTGRSLDECMRFANAAAALTTTGLGCVLPVPKAAEVEALLARKTPS